MKNLRRNVLILTVGAIFLSFGMIGQIAEAQTKTSAKATPTPKKSTKPTPKTTAGKSAATVKSTPKATPKTTAKATPKPTPKATPKPVELPQIIVAATSVRVRTNPDTASDTIQFAKLGTVFPISGQTDKWYEVKLNTDKNGFISKTVSQTFTNAKRGEIYQKLADKYLKQASIDFTTASQTFDFLTAATKEIKIDKTLADLQFKRLQALSITLKKLPSGKQDQSPYKEFLKANEKEIVYSEPSAEWYVNASGFWELHEKNKSLPIGEEIAWQAAQTPIPGECEGYINCYLYLLRVTDGEYLNFYPNGKYSRQALRNVTNLLEPIAADANEKAVYTSASDTSDRADFNRYLTELRAIIAKTPFIEKSKPLAQIKQIAEGHR